MLLKHYVVMGIAVEYDDDKTTDVEVQELLLNKFPEKLGRNAEVFDVRYLGGFVKEDGVPKDLKIPKVFLPIVRRMLKTIKSL